MKNRKIDLPSWMDQEKAKIIVELRGMGYTQEKIAEEMDLSQQTVSRYLAEIRRKAEESDNMDKFFLGLLLGGIGGTLLGTIIKELMEE
ncbi:hypothetical protein AKJ41_00645 [candidate division MSBL1 archaeon SCGC-AAA259O05]|uniref:RNA polymerase sigma-70 region 4 domain-containing protein n=1 Tax=candidate division MSBL1 archaeon SCGC-AAA259O05 TaxID=1698271 RepID=A0A133V5L7_9EURY|nr:hypothetical protein AKJ41_00645 [candidate division MSBL1 archaeon SCGC-AAA259O05]